MSEQTAPGAAASPYAAAGFAATVALSAALLFVVQPMLGKALLPAFGGGAAIWTAVMLFFQVGLLAGSALFHATTTFLGPAAAAVIHVGLAIVGVALVPGVPAPRETGLGPAIDVLATLAAGYGPIVLVLGANAAALQAWYARAVGQPPWWLYAVSNAGSFLGLIAYPLVIETALPLSGQSMAWVQAFAACVLGLAACAWAGLRRAAPAAEKEGRMTLRPDWLVLAALPSSLLLGVTEYVTVTVAPLPMLWVLPLAIYLASWIGAFWRPEAAVRLGRGLLLLLCLPLLFEFSQPIVGQKWPAIAVAIHVGGLLAAGLLAHGQLALRRPAETALTGFYLHIAAGGAIGGMLNALAAPMLLDRPAEYPVVLALLMLGFAVGRGLGAWLVWGLIAGIVAFGPMLAASSRAIVLGHDRDFYGTVTVLENEGRRTMMHGRTVHGFQHLDAARRLEPSSYYHREGGIGRLIATMEGLRRADVSPMEALLVGLGPGTMACYASDRFRPAFVEISPAVVTMARRWFDFLAECGNPPVELGDGRLRIGARPPASLDLIVIDAYSGVSIPVHMATAEATALFLDRLAPGGAMAVHVSSSHFDLAPLVAAAAREAGAETLMFNAAPDNVPSSWLAVTRDTALAARLRSEGWSEVAPAARPWRDDRWDLLSAMRRAR